MQVPNGRRTVTRVEIVNAIYVIRGCESRTRAAEYLEMVLDEISNALVRGEHMKLSSFGVFSVRGKRERTGRNPKTRVEAPIAPRRVLTFKPSPVLRDAINEANSPGVERLSAKSNGPARFSLLSNPEGES
jgi:integration host factor subunit alpha